MKNRFSIFKHRYRLVESQAMRRLGKKSPDDGKLEFADILICFSILGLLNIDLLPESVPYREHILIFASVAIVALGAFLKFRRLAPRSCWTKASWAAFMVAVACSALPWILYAVGEDSMSMTLATHISLFSILLWLIFAGCFMRLRYIRRRSREEIAMMRLREKRRRNLQTF
ncbi:MAG: hypothetical protein IKY56_01065 [Alistipes sp.]|nr:hypothetical protein [Alistipes sp.]